MKQVLKHTAFLLLTGILFFVACKKEKTLASGVMITPINVIPANTGLQLIPFGTLSIPREYVCVATAGSKIVFAGGAIQTTPLISTSRVDIYDTVTKNWSTAELSLPRSALVATSLGNKIYFTDGFINSSSRVDIYDASTNTWSTNELTAARAGLASGSAGNKVVFAGGYSPFDNKVDILDASNNSWSANLLSDPRTDISVGSLGNKIYFSGGWLNTGEFTNKVDVYDALSNGWSTITMTQPRWFHVCIAADNKIFWAGGCSSFDSNGDVISNNSVEIYDLDNGGRAYHQLSRSPFYAGIVNNKIIFLTAISGSSFPIDMFDIRSQTWSEYNISLPSWTAIGWRQSIIAAGDNIYIVGNNVLGTNYPKQIWKLKLKS